MISCVCFLLNGCTFQPLYQKNDKHDDKNFKRQDRVKFRINLQSPARITNQKFIIFKVRKEVERLKHMIPTSYLRDKVLYIDIDLFEFLGTIGVAIDGSESRIQGRLLAEVSLSFDNNLPFYKNSFEAVSSFNPEHNEELSIVFATQQVEERLALTLSQDIILSIVFILRQNG
jgi:hypothetical protein